MSEQSSFGKVLRNNLLLEVVGAVVFALLNPLTNGGSMLLFIFGI
jgi:hypothetical protein